MRPDELSDADWLSPVDTTCDTIPAPASSEPAKPAVWRCDGTGAEPTSYGSLLAATSDAPVTPDAMVAFSGEMLATADEADARWNFTEAGRRQLAVEMAEVIERDHDRFLGIVLAEDLASIRRSA